MKELNEEKNLEVSGAIAKTEQFIEKNKKNITIIAAAIIVVALGIWAYVGLVAHPRQVRAAEDMFAAEQWFNQGEYEKALNGEGDMLGFIGVIDEYRNTKSGNLARYYAGICQLNLGKYEEAAKLLKAYKGKDAMTGAEALMLLGDCYAEMDNTTEAINYYKKAADKGDNMVVAPVALFKAAMELIQKGDTEEAVKCLEKVKYDYPQTPIAAEVDKYISYAENK